jgi:hypothetical protein
MLAGLCSMNVVSAQAQSQELFDSSLKTQSSENSQLKQKTEELIELLQNEDFGAVRESLHPDLRSQWSTEELEQSWNELLSENGSLEQLADVNIVKSVRSDLVLSTLDFENGTKDLIVSFDKDGKIIGSSLPKTESLEEIAEQFLDYLVTEDYAKARGYLHPFLKEDIFPEQIKEQWQSLLATTGSFQKLDNIAIKDSSNIDGTHLAWMTLEFADVTEEMLLTFDRDKNITEVDLTQNRFE